MQGQYVFRTLLESGLEEFFPHIFKRNFHNCNGGRVGGVGGRYVIFVQYQWQKYFFFALMKF